MPKHRQIPRLFSDRLSDGTIVWHWKPSATLRARHGLRNTRLGVGGTKNRPPAAIVTAANDLNAQVDALGADHDGAVIGCGPRVIRFDELVRRYQASSQWSALAESSRHQYRIRMEALSQWAGQGQLRVDQIDAAMCRDLAESFYLKASPTVTASTLRVLRLLLNWAVREGIIATNPAAAVSIRTPDSRTTRISLDMLDALIAAADNEGFALALELGFWTVQRPSDILGFGRLTWQQIDNVDRRDAARLANARGRVMGFRVPGQRKTGAAVTCPVPPHLHDRIERMLARANGHGPLLSSPVEAGKPLNDTALQRQFAAARVAAGYPDIQFRDLRRSGISFYAEAGAELPWITSLSGHAGVTGRKTIIDTYLIGNARSAAACVAAGLRRWDMLKADRAESAR